MSGVILTRLHVTGPSPNGTKSPARVALALKRGMPFPIQPMLPTSALPFHRVGWVYEEKYDGWRIMAYKHGDAVCLLSRNGLGYTGRFGELAAAIASLPASTVILDGEVVVFDDRLLSRLDLLQRSDARALMTPPVYLAFDCLYASGRDLRHHPLRARRERLEALIDGQQCVLPARRLPAHGLEAWEAVLRRGYEGLVAKDESSTYLGGRTRLWLKVKRRATGNENRNPSSLTACRGAYRDGPSLLIVVGPRPLQSPLSHQAPPAPPSRPAVR